jgi:cytochrome c oxidase cbb3-type subunit 3
VAGSISLDILDEYWINGGGIKNIFKTIKYGVTGKGMIAWEKSLNGLQMAQLASYIKSIGGTNPRGALAPQGNKMEPSGTSSDTTKTATVADTLATALK